MSCDEYSMLDQIVISCDIGQIENILNTYRIYNGINRDVAIEILKRRRKNDAYVISATLLHPRFLTANFACETDEQLVNDLYWLNIVLRAELAYKRIDQT